MFNMKKKKVIFVAGVGGHLTELLQLDSIFKEYDYTLITEKTEVTKGLKDKYNIKYYLYNNKKNYIKYLFVNLINLFKSIGTFISIRQDVVVTTGPNTGVYLCYLAHMFKKKVIFIETYANITNSTKSGRIVYKFADHFVVQWESLKKEYPNALYFGGIN